MMTLPQQIVTIALCALATMATRFPVRRSGRRGFIQPFLYAVSMR